THVSPITRRLSRARPLRAPISALPYPSLFSSSIRHPPSSTLFPYTTLFRSQGCSRAYEPALWYQERPVTRRSLLNHNLDVHTLDDNRSSGARTTSPNSSRLPRRSRRYARWSSATEAPWF